MSRGLVKILAPLALLVAGTAAALAIALSRERIEPRPTPPPAPLVTTLAVRPQPVRLDVSSYGTVEAATESVLSSQVAGRIEWVSPAFEAGTFVADGEMLLRIDPRDFELAVVRAEATVAGAELRLTTERSEARVAASEWSDLGQGTPDPLVLRQPQLAEAEAALASARAELERARLDLSRTEVVSPYDARVVSREVDVGQYVTVASRLGRLHATDRVEVALPVPGAELAWLELDLSDNPQAQPPVELAADFGGRRWTWHGRIVRTGAEIDPRTRMLPLVAEIPEPYAAADEGRPPLQVGLFVEATIQGRLVDDVIVLPRVALLGDGTVWVVGDDERLQRRPVSVLRTERERVLLSAGLQPGERVVVSALEVATEGMVVRSRTTEEDERP